ncbi:MAG: glycosyltransferase family 2 protein [Lachnospiraceae bacterium]|nr:glycosyltransferase family 2 protein [Lachnospiraceae bacterium]
MITISVCMIVKNEQDRLDTCLKSLVSIADEIIVVDTGSVDDTKEIAKKYTDKVSDFAWTGSFSDARNHAFSLATCDYIYSADADEELDAQNIDKFLKLKQMLDPDIDIVQMYYCNQLQNNTIYSFDRELRPKLYKRLRPFVWEETIHEAVRLSPVIYDSDIDIIHRPGEGHGARDLAAFERLTENGATLSERLLEIYCKELYIAGTKENFMHAKAFFDEMADKDGLSNDQMARIFTIGSRAARLAGDTVGFIKYISRAAAGDLMSSELCCELGDYFRENGDMNEAKLWYYNAIHETSAYLDIRYQEEIPKRYLDED